MLPRWPCKTKHTPETTATPGIRWSTPFGCPWPPSTSPWPTAFVVVLICILLLKLGGFKKCPRIWGKTKLITKGMLSSFLNPTDFYLNQITTSLDQVDLGEVGRCHGRPCWLEIRNPQVPEVTSMYLVLHGLLRAGCCADSIGCV